MYLRGCGGGCCGGCGGGCVVMVMGGVVVVLIPVYEGFFALLYVDLTYTQSSVKRHIYVLCIGCVLDVHYATERFFIT